VNEEYVNTVRLLLAIAPAVFQSSRFAMKGGTALNLFVQDLPRLSVDIDVVLVDHTLGRDQALQAIAEDLAAAKSVIATMGYRTSLPTTKSGDNVKLLVEPTFTNEFAGMTRHPIELLELERTQGRLIRELPRLLTSTHREFLLSLVRAEPRWDLMPFGHLADLPAMQWKMLNLRKLRSRNPKRFEAQHRELAARFESIEREAR